MDISYIVAGACALLGVLALVFRSNAAYMFLALCGGYVVSNLVSEDLTQIFNSFVSVDIPVYSYVQIFVLAIMPVILLFVYKKGARKSFILQIIPAIAFAVLAFMFVTEMLPYDLQNKITESQIYTTAENYFAIAASAGAISCLIYLISKRPRHDKKDKHK